MSTKRIRYDQKHWQKLVERQAQSGLSVARFCREHRVAYESFMNWRKKLQDATAQSSRESDTTFVELTAPTPIPDFSLADTQSESGVCVELTLGAGIELRITRSA